jgi:hypothetical protein
MTVLHDSINKYINGVIQEYLKIVSYNFSLHTWLYYTWLYLIFFSGGVYSKKKYLWQSLHAPTKTCGM